jgi:hypothetical protein
MSRSYRGGMRRSSIVGWVALAILGLAVAAAVSLAASRISSQRIGLASEPLTAGNRLAPRTTTPTTPSSTQTTPTSTSTTPSGTTTTPSGTTTPADRGSQGGGRGRDGDHDADDD